MGDKLMEIRRCYNIADGVLLIAVGVLLGFPTWVKGGELLQYLDPFPWIALVIFAIFLILPTKPGKPSIDSFPVMSKLKIILKDPVIYTGFAFFLCIFFKGLPGAVNFTSCRELFIGFFPPFVAILIIRQGFYRPRVVKILFWVMIIDAAVLAIVGIFLPVFNGESFNWLSSLIPRQPFFFFSVFGNPNNAGAFFLLHLSLATGLFFHYFLYHKFFTGYRCFTDYQTRKWFVDNSIDKSSPNAKKKCAILITLIMLLFYAVHLTRSVLSMIFAWAMMSSILIFIFYKSIREKNRLLLINFLYSIPIIFIWAMILSPFYLSSIGYYSLNHSIQAENSLFKSTGFYESFAGLIPLLILLAILLWKIFSSPEWKQPFIIIILIGNAAVLIQLLTIISFPSVPIIIGISVMLAGLGRILPPGKFIHLWKK